MASMRDQFVSMVYADHNSTRKVKAALAALLSNYGENTAILNIGSGNKRLREDILNLDIVPGPNVDIVGSAGNIPLNNNSLDLIISQEAFEHIQDPELALSECRRCLKPRGRIYFQVPFIIGYHPGPTDFVRFTREGVSDYLQRSGFVVERVEITVGGATGFYRIAVEFFAILLSGPISALYFPSKALTAILLYPIKWLDMWFNFSPQRDRIAGGYYAVAQKPDLD